MTTSNRFILKPDFYNLEELGLDYKDLLTYITIRSFYNSNSKYCYPSYRAIAKRSGLSVGFIGTSMKRLWNAGILTVWPVAGRRRKAYWYVFDNIQGLNKIPFELVNDRDLTTNEKSTLILLSEYCKQGYCQDSIAEIADKSGVTTRVITTHYQTLCLKGYIKETFREDLITNTLRKRFTFTNMLDWDFRAYKSDNEESNQPVEDMINIYMSHRRR